MQHNGQNKKTNYPVNPQHCEKLINHYHFTPLSFRVICHSAVDTETKIDMWKRDPATIKIQNTWHRLGPGSRQKLEEQQEDYDMSRGRRSKEGIAVGHRKGSLSHSGGSLTKWSPVVLKIENVPTELVGGGEGDFQAEYRKCQQAFLSCRWWGIARERNQRRTIQLGRKIRRKNNTDKNGPRREKFSPVVT